MSYKFNPFTGSLDYFEAAGVGSSITFNKTKTVVDSSFLTTPDIALGAMPLSDSELVTLNGLEIDDTNYSIAGSTLTMVTTQLEVGDNIYIIFAN